MGRGERVYCFGEDWLSLTCWCLLDGTNKVCESCWFEDGCSGCVRQDPVVLEVSLRRTTWCVVQLETSIVVIGVVVVTRIVVVARVACGTIVAMRRRLCDILYTMRCCSIKIRRVDQNRIGRYQLENQWN